MRELPIKPLLISETARELILQERKKVLINWRERKEET